MRRGLSILPCLLVAACAAAGTSVPPTTPATLATTPFSEAPDPSSSAPAGVSSLPPVAGWPTVRRAGVTMTAGAEVAPPPLDGCPAPAPALVVMITLTGLAPGEVVSLPGTATYDFGVLACGVQPSPCVWGSDTTDPSVHLCGPEYAAAAKGTATASAAATADAKGTAIATLRFIIPESERPCPAGASRPWYVESGSWAASVTDAAHGLRLVGPPDLVIGP